ncbi:MULTISPECIES: NAD(P)-dependent oxidoreductase [Rhodomicrobium]|uniref:NAD(P)-dependent oxidoreductase n=1 Tax=Rhodomicrobium TaxID=1068 RepID=UPI000B4BE5E0|nr:MULTISPECIES: NAD(P)-dependent oxidoreductase [Rhodomicrobium]
MDKTVGIIGLGIMGGAISRNLAERGWTVIGYDIDRAKCDALASAGIQIADSPADAARRAPVIMTSLPSPRAVLAVAEDIAGSGAPPRIVVELSTLSLADKLSFAATLEAAGHTPLDCPLSGTGSQAENRDLVIYASGDSAAIARLEPLFLDFGKKLADLGVYGNGSRMKFVANYLVAINNVATAEAMVLGMQAGLDPRQVIEVVGPGAAGSRIFELRAPMMAEDRYAPPTMRMSTWKKDMSIIGEFADGLGCPTPLFSASNEVYEKGLAMDLGDLDTASVCRVIEAMGGFKR